MIYRQPHFVTPLECEHLIALIDARSEPSRTFEKGGDTPSRQSQTCWMRSSDLVVRALMHRIAQIVGAKPECAEAMQGQRYIPGDHYEAHYDFIRTDRPHWKEQARLGGQRTWTTMVYLNQPLSGGQTRFPAIDQMITPEAGLLIAWQNLAPDGTPNCASLHEALPVLMGEKYVVTQWFRERRCRQPGVRPAARRLFYGVRRRLWPFGMTSR